jgi:diadenylate cyclase
MIQALKGLVFLVVLFFAAQSMELTSIRWVLGHLFQISISGVLIIFQTDLRRGLTRIGQTPLFRSLLKEENVVREIIKSVFAMSQSKTGALIAVEREVSLKGYLENGIALDGILSGELIQTIFAHNTPFHDGGIVVQGSRVLAVGCVFPLSSSQKLSKNLGMRHRAALGLSEETDALVIVVSEETGSVTLMNQGKILREIDEEKLRLSLAELYQPHRSPMKPRAAAVRKENT